jgi:hypothetical protein
MKKLTAKLLLTLVLITGVSVNSFAAVDNSRFPTSDNSISSQFDIYQEVYSFMMTTLSYLSEPLWEGEKKPVIKGCQPKEITTKERQLKCKLMQNKS